MNQMYASAVGTTVLQLREIPPRGSEFDGALAIFTPKEGVDEQQISAALEQYGTIVRIESRLFPPWVVYFETHEQAVRAKAECAEQEMPWAGLDTLYNERPYEESGW